MTNLLELAIKEIRNRDQWRNGQVVVIWQAGRRQAWVKNQDGMLVLILFENADSLMRCKYSQPFKVGYFHPQDYNWQESTNLDDYAEWAAQTGKQFGQATYKIVPGDGGMSDQELDSLTVNKNRWPYAVNVELGNMV